MGVKYPGKKRYLTLEWPITKMVIFQHFCDTFCSVDSGNGLDNNLINKVVIFPDITSLLGCSCCRHGQRTGHQFGRPSLLV